MRLLSSKQEPGKRTVVFLMAAVMLFVTVIAGCEKKEPENPDDDPSINQSDYTEVNRTVQNIMYFVYYWNYKIDSKLVTGQRFKPVPAQTEPVEYFNSLLYDESMAPSGSREYDRWSFMYPYDEFDAVMVEGEYKSFGYFLARVPIDPYPVKVCYVYADSPMDKAGIERGYELVRLNGSNVSDLLRNGTINDELAKETGRFVFADRNGTALPEKTISAAVLKIDPILYDTAYNVDGKKVGYVVYNSFISASKSAITDVLRGMNDVDEFVFDLRYNGGGDVSVADAICEYLLPATAGTDSVDFAKYTYSARTNANAEDIGLKDEIRKIKRNENALNISRLFVIVSDMTASASEEVINSMKPFVDEVILVGTTTEGKPTGMVVFVDNSKDPEWAIAPITFRIDNKNGEGSYFAGIPPTKETEDDLYRDFGVDATTLQGEGCLQTVLEYIGNGGRWPASAAAKSVGEGAAPQRLIKLKGLQIHAGCM